MDQQVDRGISVFRNIDQQADRGISVFRNMDQPKKFNQEKFGVTKFIFLD